MSYDPGDELTRHLQWRLATWRRGERLERERVEALARARRRFGVDLVGWRLVLHLAFVQWRLRDAWERLLCNVRGHDMKKCKYSPGAYCGRCGGWDGAAT